MHLNPFSLPLHPPRTMMSNLHYYFSIVVSLGLKAKLLKAKMIRLNYIVIEDDTAELQGCRSYLPKMCKEILLSYGEPSLLTLTWHSRTKSMVHEKSLSYVPLPFKSSHQSLTPFKFIKKVVMEEEYFSIVLRNKTKFMLTGFKRFFRIHQWRLAFVTETTEQMVPRHTLLSKGHYDDN